VKQKGVSYFPLKYCTLTAGKGNSVRHACAHIDMHTDMYAQAAHIHTEKGVGNQVKGGCPKFNPGKSKTLLVVRRKHSEDR